MHKSKSSEDSKKCLTSASRKSRSSADKRKKGKEERWLRPRWNESGFKKKKKLRRRQKLPGSGRLKNEPVRRSKPAKEPLKRKLREWQLRKRKLPGLLSRLPDWMQNSPNSKDRLMSKQDWMLKLPKWRDSSRSKKRPKQLGSPKKKWQELKLPESLQKRNVKPWKQPGLKQKGKLLRSWRGSDTWPKRLVLTRKKDSSLNSSSRLRKQLHGKKKGWHARLKPSD